MRVLIIIFISVLTGVVSAQDSLNLSGAIGLGLENNYQIRLSQKQLDIDRNNNTWGAAGRYPNISLSVGANGIADRYVNPSLLAIAREADSTIDVNTQQTLTVTPAANLNWMLFNGMAVNVKIPFTNAHTAMSRLKLT